MTVSSKGTSQRIAIGERAAEAGVLLGRYERCDTHGATVFAHHGISRVHLLVVEVEGALYAVDTGSTNGTFQGSDEVRIVPLVGGTELVFGDGLARMEWMPP
jgi:pSer/pThr/pTyr-binding forkhead associated (FHA) protein